MAGMNNADPLPRITVEAPTPPISKDMQGSDTSVPLSPQWLLPKLGDNKLGLAAGEKCNDPLKALGNVEDLNVVEKRKDVFRPSFYDTDKVRRDCWADEERETNPALRRDIQKEVEELGDTRKLERWSNNPSRHSNEARHFPSERWTGSGSSVSKESAYDPRRESKWNTRWGPDDKEFENKREKWLGKDGDSSHNKGTHHQTIHAKDIKSQGKDTDKEGEHYSRSWKPSPIANRGKGETSPYFMSATNKSASLFGYGRGKGDTAAHVFSADRSRVCLSGSNTSGGSTRQLLLGTAAERSDGSHIDPPGLRYSRMKLFDIYRMTDLKGYSKVFEGFEEFPSLIQADYVVPLALTEPITEELVIMEAMEKGEILSSGVPQASNDSSKNYADSGLLHRTKSGIGEDIVHVASAFKDERTNHGKKDSSIYIENPVYDKCSRTLNIKVPSSKSFGQYQDSTLNSEVVKLEVAPNSAHDPKNREASKLENTVPWRSQSVGRSLSSSNDMRVFTEDESGALDFGWLNRQEDIWIEPRNRCTSSSPHIGDDPQCQNPVIFQSDMKIESQIRGQASRTIEQVQGNPFTHRENLKDQKLQQFLSPEHLSLFYKDPQGQIQGPFSGNNLIEWFDAGYFGIDLLVRLASAPADTPFSMLGDVIPQLRTRIRPPPGFGASRPIDIVEVSNREKAGGAANVHVGISDLEMMKSGQVVGNESNVEAENRFLESLMAGRINNSLSEGYLSEGMLGYNCLTGGRPLLELDTRPDRKYIPNARTFERPSLPTSYRPDSAPPVILSMADSLRGIPIPPKALPQVGEISHTHVDLLSILQSATNKTPPPPINSALPQWPSFPEIQTKNTLGNIDIMKDALGLHPNQQSSQIRFGTQPSKMQAQFQPSLPNQTPNFGLSTGLIPPEKSAVLDFSQEAQMANLLRQQYILTQQVQSQVPPPTHLNQMELLLLMQRQKLEQQQQYQLLSQAISGLQLRNRCEEQSFGSSSTEAVDTNAAMKTLQKIHEVAHTNQPVDVLVSNDNVLDCLSNLNLPGAQDSWVEHSTLNLHNQVIDPFHANDIDASYIPEVESTQTSFTDKMLSTSDDLVESQELSQNNENVATASNDVKHLAASKKNEVSLNLEPYLSEIVDCVKTSPSAISNHGETPESKAIDAKVFEVKKASEKKSRKNKNLQSVKGTPGQKSKPCFNDGGAKKDVPMEGTESLCETSREPQMERLDSHGTQLTFEGDLDEKCKIYEVKDEVKVKEIEYIRPSSSNLAWKPSPGQKVKSLLEIQVEEQSRSQVQSLAAGMMPKNIQANVSLTLEQKHSADTVNSLSHSVSENLEKYENPWNMRNKSQLNDISSEENIPELSGDINEEKESNLPPLPVQNKASVDHDFIEAKDTRKGRKKSAKIKGSTTKILLQSNSAGVSPSISISEQTKVSLQPQLDEELLPSPPFAPSFGDFVFWKGEQANTLPSPVWSTALVKTQKPAFLKDIFREQDKSTNSGRQQHSTQIPTKELASKGTGGGSSLGKISCSPPSKVQLAPSMQTSSLALGQHKREMEDDLFWGPLNQAKQGTRSDYPSLANPTSEKLKAGTPVKVVSAEGSSKSASSTKVAEHSITTPLQALKQSLPKGKKDTEPKISDATDFRDWCEAEWLRLTGTDDTTFLELCLKQTTSEAETLLRENLSSLDRGNEFIDKFVNYKKFLSPEIIEIAFRAPRSSKASRSLEAEADGVDGSNRGKKKGKKGKKVSPALLGFSVVSNRIMMGEIQTIED